MGRAGLRLSFLDFLPMTAARYLSHNSSLEVIRKRGDFLAARRGKRIHRRSFTLQYRQTDAGSPRVGFTVTKKIGGAVVRNRVKRRLRAAMREISHDVADLPMDLVVIARASATTIRYGALLDELRSALLEAREAFGAPTGPKMPEPR
ncbi:MAG: ribonuclease P protein component [Pseudomonadota bacterium]